MIGAEFSPVNENKKSWFCISKIEFHDTKQYIPKEFSHIFSTTEQTHQAEKIKNRRKNEVVKPFEPSSTVVHPCTTVEGEMICFYLPVDVVLLSDGIRGQAAGCAET